MKKSQKDPPLKNMKKKHKKDKKHKKGEKNQKKTKKQITIIQKSTKKHTFCSPFMTTPNISPYITLQPTSRNNIMFLVW